MTTPLPVRAQVAFIRAMLRNFHKVASLPRGARIMFMANRCFTDSRRAVVIELMLQAGCWERAAHWLRGQMPAESFKKLCSWAAQVKGGAS